MTAEQRFKLKPFVKSPPSSSGTIELTQRRVFILPTRRGIGFLSTILLLLLTAFIYNNNLLYFLAFLLLSLLLTSILHTYQSLAGLRVQAGEITPVFAGDTAFLPLNVSDPDGRQRQALRAVMADALEFDVAAHQQKTVMLPVAAPKRGRLTIGTVTLDSCYPLGMFRAESSLAFDLQMLVYPKPAAAVPAYPGGGGRSAPGSQDGPPGGHDEFAGIRAYQPGDSVRAIYWKAYAKGQGLFSKCFAGEDGRRELWLDFSRTVSTQTEARLEQMCRWVIDAEQSGLRYGLLLPGREIAPDTGPRHRAACLEALALFESI
ncbi:MAG: DUF58 domain-containing protein [Methylococcaceae bacterium]|nr:DUF58 domain-containing protein [Methylococcaceae bacterium]